jgi:hypothetical protein
MPNKRAEYGRRRRSQWAGRLGQLAIVLLLALAVCAIWPRVFRRYPLESLITAGVLAIAVLSVVLYLGELTVVGWIVDFLSAIGMPKIPIVAALECEQVGEIIVVTLRDNIATVFQCQAVQKELNRLVDEHRCDFVLDFSATGSVAMSFRRVMLGLKKAARRAAEKLGKTYRPLALPHGEEFRVFDDRRQALEEMSKHVGHGWVVLCSVPVGIRAVSEVN